MNAKDRSRVVVCRGARATEARLLDEVAKLRPRSPAELDLPVRIVVPSRSLRLHLLRRLVERHGAVAGVVVQTLGGLAHEIAERAGLRERTRIAGFEVLTRRLARGEKALASELDGLGDGYEVVVGAVRDLIDAGFGPEHEDAVEERIDELVPVVPGAERARAAALVRVAARGLEAARITGARPQAEYVRGAVEALEQLGPAALPSRRVVIHGFADLTGTAADLLTAVLRTVGATVLIDLVPDPSHPEREDVGNVFLDRLETRLGGLEREIDQAVHGSPATGYVEAPDPEAEARRVAEDVRELLGSGVVPESIGVVARHLRTLGPALRRQMLRLGVPFSGVDARVAGGAVRRRARRLADLLRRGADAELDLWLENAERTGGAELALGLRVLSLGRLRDLAELSADDRRVARGVPLPLAAGVTETASIRRSGGRLSAARVSEAVNGARAVLAVIASWPERAPVAAHRDALSRMLTALRWPEGADWVATIRNEIDDLAAEIPSELELDRDEWISAVTARLDRIGEVAIGGAGGGVQILTVTEARGRTFEHLFLCGLNRGVFPRLAPEDPMLPDAVRARLAMDVLPEMPVKARSADEERYLFAQLISAAPRIELSWHQRADGRRLAPSPFVERMLPGGDGASVERVPAVWSPSAAGGGARPAYEHAVLATRADPESLGLAVGEGRSALPGTDWTVPPNRLAAARIEVVGAAEPDNGTVPGPWSGFVGPATAPDDRIWVTHLEAVGTCPFRAFLERRLGVRPLPDPHLGLPDPDSRLLGEVVHQVLERIVGGADGGAPSDYREALEREPAGVVWPSSSRLGVLIEDAARRVIYSEGLGGFGLARLLAARARPVLAVAGEVEWNGSTRRDDVLAAEVEGEVVLESGRTLSFRADRLDTGPTATDYKTGKPMSTAKGAATREKHLLKRVAGGRLLQAMAYALAGPGGTGVGRYVALHPEIGDLPDEVREVRAAADDGQLAEAFRTAVDVIENAMDAGVAFPRVDEPGGGAARHCAWCSVAEACRRSDSSFRRALADLMEAGEASDDPAVEAARALWWLGTERTEASS
jgi:hypothetical protein